jgi:hypothetical protein
LVPPASSFVEQLANATPSAAQTSAALFARATSQRARWDSREDERSFIG